MDIKLRARLSAYSKVDSITNTCEHEYVSEEQIDELFKNMDTPSSVTKTEIDELFQTVDEPESVSKTEIDSLFANVNEPESVTKGQIDTLFKEEEQPVASVSFKDIDSLFK